MILGVPIFKHFRVSVGTVITDKIMNDNNSNS